MSEKHENFLWFSMFPLWRMHVSSFYGALNEFLCQEKIKTDVYSIKGHALLPARRGGGGGQMLSINGDKIANATSCKRLQLEFCTDFWLQNFRFYDFTNLSTLSIYRLSTLHWRLSEQTQDPIFDCINWQQLRVADVRPLIIISKEQLMIIVSLRRLLWFGARRQTEANMYV